MIVLCCSIVFSFTSCLSSYCVCTWLIDSLSLFSCFHLLSYSLSLQHFSHVEVLLQCHAFFPGLPITYSLSVHLAELIVDLKRGNSLGIGVTKGRNRQFSALLLSSGFFSPLMLKFKSTSFFGFISCYLGGYVSCLVKPSPTFLSH